MTAGIPCPACGHKHSGVTDTRPTRDTIKRRRECERCHVRFTTYERVTSRLITAEKYEWKELSFKIGKVDE